MSVPDSSSLFSIQFEAKQKAGLSSMEITSSPAVVELFDRTSTILTVTLKNGQVEVLDITSSTSSTNQAETIKVAANAPNPLQTYTNIPVTTDSAQSAQLYLFDTSGKIVKVIGVQLQKGENQITLQRNLFPSKGVYYYQLFSNFETNKPLSKGYRIVVL
ncbi:MAG: T9SS type A sorting domain-containing protein [Saprospiraceae bacterium]|nr:T9SS type A sorting domain-containing protein [Saprospiraceae bacterium]